MRVYIAARTNHRAVASLLSIQLEKHGHAVVSTWHEHRDLKHFSENGGEEFDPDDAMLHALRDLRELGRADQLVNISSHTPSNGGKHFETGYMLARGAEICLIGRREHVFHHHPRILRFRRPSDYMTFMKERDEW